MSANLIFTIKKIDGFFTVNVSVTSNKTGSLMRLDLKEHKVDIGELETTIAELSEFGEVEVR